MKRLGNTNKELTPRMKQVAQAMFEHPEMNQIELGELLGISRGRVGHILRCDRFLAAFPILARARIKGMVPSAVNRMGYLMTQNANLEVSRKVVDSVLNTEKVLESVPLIQINQFANLNAEELKRITDDVKDIPSDVIETTLADPDAE